MNKTLTMFPEHFLRNYIGLDLLDEKTSNYPPHNIEKLTQDDYLLTLAVAGFGHQNLKAFVQNGRLIIEGKRIPEGYQENPYKADYIYKGISFRDFRQEFVLGDNVDVTEIHLDNGLLQIKLQKMIPESAKPKYIEIKDGGVGEPPTIEKEKTAKISLAK
jgi:molecular chaperone IbpA